MPSMLGFVSLAGVVVNDSMLVEFIKSRCRAGDTALWLTFWLPSSLT